MRMARKRNNPAPAPEPVAPPDPELVQKASELGVPELAKPLSGAAKKPVRVFHSEVEARVNTPQKGDIIQVVVKPHEFLARIGIVHDVEGDNLICYQPGKKGFPHKFKVAAEVVVVVGKAKLKYDRDKLPEPSVYSDEAAKLDNI